MVSWSSRPLKAALAVLLISACAGTQRVPIARTPGSPRRLSTAERDHVLDGDYMLYRRGADIPIGLQRAFSSLQPFPMAENEDDWQATDDIVLDGKVKWMRLLRLAGCSPSRCFIHYTTGGIGVNDSVVVFDVNAGEYVFSWGAKLEEAVTDLSALRSLIAAGKYSDDAEYTW